MNFGARLPGETDRRHEPRKDSAGAEIEPKTRRRSRRLDLKRVGEVPRPYMRQGRPRDQIDRLLPFDEQLGVDGKALFCFGWQGEKCQRRGAISREVGLGHPARLIRAASSVRAAGVTPSIRLACPMVRGLIVESFCWISA